MIDYQQWAARHPRAAEELEQMMHAHRVSNSTHDNKSESYTQQKARIEVAKQGGVAWRNNVGALKTKEQHTCPRCQFHFEVKQAPIRWGLCNDSAGLNKVYKSSDLIGIMPRQITQEMVGSVIGQFVAIETKKQGWTYKGDPHETAQLAWLTLVASKGGLSFFSTGDVTL